MSPAQPTSPEELSSQLHGSVIAPDDAAYDEARKLFNGMIDKRPALIARCSDQADVTAAVNYARESGSLLAVRGGGHNGGGLGSVDDGVVIDLSGMNDISVDADGGTVRVEGGCTWGEVDTATHGAGMATPSGIISTTGVGGLTLGGGIGYLARKHGLTIDNLLQAEVVLADGRSVKANERENPDLFWAIRGGGGNFGVVTSFLFKLHPVETVIGGPTLWPLEMSADVMRWYDGFIADAPRELTGFFAFLTVPPAPPFPESLHLKKMCGVVWCYAGSEADADDVLAPVREFGPPALDGTGPVPFPGLQSAFDGLYSKGDQWYWRADFVDELSDDAIARHIEFAERMPTMLSTMHLYPIDGAVHDVGADETAFSYRNSRWAEVIVGVDPDPAMAPEITKWTVDYWDAVHPFSAGGAYVNFMMDEGQDRIKATYGDNYQRLTEVKATYDPDNLFRVNQNIQPAG
jgi:UDP-N-acetylenolpyruvoylglucosamine reductase